MQELTFETILRLPQMDLKKTLKAELKSRGCPVTDKPGYLYADVKSVTENTSRETLKRCRVQSKYAGRVTDVHKGIVYVRLSNGVNAVAHSCYDRRTPGKKDDVSFVVTKLDEERSIAVGIITRIIRQNL